MTQLKCLYNNIETIYCIGNNRHLFNTKIICNPNIIIMNKQMFKFQTDLMFVL